MTSTISSLQNPRVKNAVKLRRHRARERQSLVLIDGLREVERAQVAGVEFVEVFVCQALLALGPDEPLVERLQQTSAEVLHVTPAVYEKLAYGDRLDGIMAVARAPRRRLEDLEPPECPLIAVLEGVEKPGNVGAVVRTADGAGFDAVILADTHTDPFNPNAIRASLATVFTMPVCTATTADTIAWLQRRGIRIVTALVEAEDDYTRADFTGPTAIVLGNEATGLSAAWRTEAVTPVALPMLGEVDSLNVSATAAVLSYEACRQRRR